MKYYQLIATKQGTTLIKRYFNDGRTYIKNLPIENNVKVYTQLKSALRNKPITIELLNNGWILTTKTDTDEDMETAAQKVVDEILGTEFEGLNTIISTEKQFLEKAGYEVKVSEGEV